MTTFDTRTGRRAVLCLFVLAAITAIFVLPFQMRSKASKGLIDRTESHEADLPNYDIRSDKAAFEKIAAFRSTSGKSASDVADVRDTFVRGEATLRQRIPTLKTEYNIDIRIPEVITAQTAIGRNFLTPPTTPARTSHANVLIDFLKSNTELVGVDARQIDALKTVADYTNPDGNLSFVELNQAINGIPVFRGEVKAGFTRNGEMIRVINNLAPALDYDSLSTEFGDPLRAVRTAANLIHNDTSKLDLKKNESESTAIKAVFGTGDRATTAEKMYFPTEPGVAVAAWRVLIWQPVNSYYVIVDGQTGTMLWRKDITDDQAQAATYQVYTNPNAMINSADNPAPMTPGPISPNGVQGPITTRSTVTRVGNEAPYEFNNLGWMTDGTNVTDGNNVEAGVDRVAPDGVDATQVGAPNRVFDSLWNPPPGMPPPGDAPLTTEAQRGAVIQMFYIMNLYHDELYRLGFNEQAHNFQQDNFGRGGSGGDRVSAEGQDSSGTNNANFGTPADGGRGQMQMYIWTGPNPDYDGTTDAEVIIHEVTHGTSNRLHGNASGLSTNMSGGMGEGWGDFYAHCMLSEPSDPINGIYTVGGYATYLGSGGYVNNYYYGIRRFPKAVIAFTGGPNNRPHNPLTFADVDSTKINLSDGAFARGPFGSSTADAVHNMGEVWNSALWEVRAKLVTRLGWAVGNRKVLQLVTDGMKLAPLGPTFLQERDAIIAAAQAGGSPPDVADVWAGFALRGMGASASIQNPGSGNGDTRVTEGFDLPNLAQTPNLTISDTGGNGNGVPEPGETLALTIPLSNNTGNPATGTTLQIVGGGAANYGTIDNGQTVSRQASYTVPAATACGSIITLTINVNSSLGPVAFTRSFGIGQPTTTASEAFDGVVAPAIPAGWTAVPLLGGINFVTSTNAPDTAPNAAFAADPATVGGGSDLTSPSMPITAPSALLTFRQKYDTEGGWDGGALEISINGGAFADIVTAGGTFIQNGYNGSLGNYSGANNPIGGRAAWTGDSGGYITTIVRLPANAAGQNVQFKWRFGADNNTGVVGWWVDSVQVAGAVTCTTSVRSRADFDGDGRTDLSVFRPSEGNWFLNRSTSGFAAINWGLSSDVLVPGDYDGDGKADTAIFRADANEASPDFYILNSGSGTVTGLSWGVPGDVPVTGDYDGDGKTDVAVYRASTNGWYIIRSTAGTIAATFGAAGDVPVVMDPDTDGASNIGVFRPASNTWYIATSLVDPAHNFTATPWGQAGDVLVPADYDGDGREDVAVFRPSDGVWYVRQSSNGVLSATQFGAVGDVPVPGDYDGDGKDDQAVYRGGIWYLNGSTAGFSAAAFGVASDTPIPRRYIP